MNISEPALPPRPRGFPFLGNLIDVRLEELRDLGALAKRFGPVFSLRLGVHTIVVLTSADSVREVCVGNASACADRPSFLNTETISGGGRSTLLGSGEAAAARRSLLVRAFLQPQHLPEFTRLVSTELDLILSSLDGAGRTVQFYRDVLDKARFDVGTRILTATSPGSDRLELRSAVEDEARHFGPLLADFVPPLRPWTRVRLRPLARAIDRFRASYGRLIRQRQDALARGERCPGALDSVLIERERMIGAGRQEIAQHCDDEALAYMMYNLLGTMNPTHISVMRTVWLLLRHPEAIERVRAEIDEGTGGRYLHAVVQEAMRLQPPTPSLVPRLVTRDIVMKAGYLIPRGTIVMANIASAGHDPAFWDEPGAFRPERFLDDDGAAAAHSLPFGVGPRACPAQGLGTEIVKLWIIHLLARFDLAEETGAVAAPVRNRAHIFNEMPPDFRVRLTPRT